MKCSLRFSAAAHAIAFFCLAFAAAIPASAQDATQPVKLTLTTIDVPGATVTGISGINTAGDMVGDYGQYTSEAYSGFLYSNGTFTYFDYPGQQVTIPGGINDSGLIVGLATQEASQGAPIYGFLYDGITFTTLQDGNSYATNAYGINNAGVVVGSAGATLYSWKGFEGRNGSYKPITFPGQCVYQYAYGINNLGEIVGFASCGIYQYGYATKNGKLHSVDFPGAQETVALGINDSGIVVGYYNPASADFYAFAVRNGKYISFIYPGAKETFAYGINASGQIVGTYTLDYQTYHGFVSSPLTPADFERPGCCQTAVVKGQ